MTTKFKHVMIFEEFDNDGQSPMDRMYASDDWVKAQRDERGLDDPEPEPATAPEPEVDEDDEIDKDMQDTPMTDRERSIYERGLDVMTINQLAAIWLKAHDRIEHKKRRDAVSSPEEKIALYNSRREALESGDWTKVPYKTLAAGLQLKDMTVARTAAKFVLIINEQPATKGEALYPKIINADKRFKGMDREKVKTMAKEALKGTMDTKIPKSRLTKPKNVDQSRMVFNDYLERYNKDYNKAFVQINSYYLRKGYNPGDINLIMTTILKDVPFRLKAWNDIKKTLPTDVSQLKPIPPKKDA